MPGYTVQSPAYQIMFNVGYGQNLWVISASIGDKRTRGFDLNRKKVERLKE